MKYHELPRRQWSVTVFAVSSRTQTQFRKSRHRSYKARRLATSLSFQITRMTWNLNNSLRRSRQTPETLCDSGIRGVAHGHQSQKCSDARRNLMCIKNLAHQIHQRMQMRVAGKQARASVQCLTFGPFGGQWTCLWMPDSKLLQDVAKLTRTLRCSAAKVTQRLCASFDTCDKESHMGLQSKNLKVPHDALTYMTHYMMQGETTLVCEPHKPYSRVL